MIIIPTNRICSECKKEKTIQEFTPYAGDTDRFMKRCNSCLKMKRDYAKKNREHLLETRRLNYAENIEERRKKGSEEMRLSRENPERRRQMKANHLRIKYNLTIEKYDEMLENQKNKCAICKTPFPESFQDWNRPCVDHCHRTNKVRGILCRKCNVSLHYIEDFKYWDSAQKYLKFNGAEDKEPLT